MKRAAITLWLFLAVPFPAHAAEGAQTTALMFVETYIRDIGEGERLRAQTVKELAEVGANPFFAIIRGSTRMSIEFRSEASILKDMRLPLPPPLADIPGKFAQLLDQKAEFHESMVDLAKNMLSGPQPGVDYGKLAVRAPELSAMLEQTDEALFKATPLVFMALIRQTPDSEGHMSRLVISKAERADLIQEIELEFGGQVDAKGQDYAVSSGAVLLGYLRNNDYKCMDEP